MTVQIVAGLPPIHVMIATVENFILVKRGVQVRIVLNEADISNELYKLEHAFRFATGQLF